jgi:AcrR family transcriptional regulator
MRAVAREVGVAAPSIYPHFADVRSLMWAVLEQGFTELTEVTTRAAARPIDARARLRAWCLAYCRFGLANPGHYRVLFDSWQADRVNIPLAQLPGYGLYQGLLAVLRPCLQPTANTEEAAVLVWAGLHGLVSLRMSKPSFPWRPIEKLVDAHLSHVAPSNSRS